MRADIYISRLIHKIAGDTLECFPYENCHYKNRTVYHGTNMCSCAAFVMLFARILDECGVQLPIKQAPLPFVRHVYYTLDTTHLLNQYTII